MGNTPPTEAQDEASTESAYAQWDHESESDSDVDEPNSANDAEQEELNVRHSRTVAVFMVRHGERIDECAAGASWREQAGDRWFDPPLTERGREQAATAARRLQDFLNQHRQQHEQHLQNDSSKSAIGDIIEIDSFDAVYCSPLLRTLQTAEQFGKVLDIPVKPLAGMYMCVRACVRTCVLRLGTHMHARVHAQVMMIVLACHVCDVVGQASKQLEGVKYCAHSLVLPSG